MDTKVTKWGNGQGVRIPKLYLEACGWHIDEPVRLLVDDGCIIIESLPVHRTLEERSAAFGGSLGPYEEYDWGEPKGREVW